MINTSIDVFVGEVINETTGEWAPYTSQKASKGKDGTNYLSRSLKA